MEELSWFGVNVRWLMLVKIDFDPVLDLQNTKSHNENWYFGIQF